MTKQAALKSVMPLSDLLLFKFQKLLPLFVFFRVGLVLLFVWGFLMCFFFDFLPKYFWDHDFSLPVSLSLSHLVHRH